MCRFVVVTSILLSTVQISIMIKRMCELFGIQMLICILYLAVYNTQYCFVLQMYSCGSLAPKMHAGKRGGGCMDHQFRQPSEPWMLTDGFVVELLPLYQPFF